METQKYNYGTIGPGTMGNNLLNLLLSNTFSKKLMQSPKGIRKVIQTAVETCIPLPAMMGALAYFDSYNSA
jgi:6-phosphogluconate dehydrogenase